MPPRVEADGVLEIGVLQPRCSRSLVHLPDEAANAGFASAADVFGQGICGVVAGGDQGGHQELPDAQGVPTLLYAGVA